MPNDFCKVFVYKGLHDQCIDARTLYFFIGELVAVPCAEDDGYVGTDFVDGLGKGITIHLGHGKICDNQVERLGCITEQLQGLNTAVGGGQVIAQTFNKHLACFCLIIFVIHKKDAFGSPWDVFIVNGFVVIDLNVKHR